MQIGALPDVSAPSSLQVGELRAELVSSGELVEELQAGIVVAEAEHSLQVGASAGGRMALERLPPLPARPSCLPGCRRLASCCKEDALAAALWIQAG